MQYNSKKSLAGANNRNVIITHRHLTVAVQANRDLFCHTDCIFLGRVFQSRVKLTQG